MELKKQLNLIYGWMHGSFNNHYQHHLEKGGGEPVHDWVWAKFYEANAPKFGDHVLWVKQGIQLTGHVYRKRIYKFQIDAVEGCVMNQIYKLKDESWFDKAENDPSSVAHLDPETDAECLEGCGVYWMFLPEENRFHATTKEGTCRLIDSKFFPGKTIIASSDIYLTSTELWTRDRIVDTDGNKLYGFKTDIHHKFVRWDTYKGRADYGNISNEISVHNQGGKYELDNGFTVKLEQAAYGGETDCKVLKLSLFSKDGEDPVGVVLTDFNASKIGGEFGSIKIFLDKVV